MLDDVLKVASHLAKLLAKGRWTLAVQGSPVTLSSFLLVLTSNRCTLRPDTAKKLLFSLIYP